MRIWTATLLNNDKFAIRTNLDLNMVEDFEFNFLCIPRVGDLIYSKWSWDKCQIKLEVVALYHCLEGLIVEVTWPKCPSRTMREWYKWYESLGAGTFI